MRIKQKEMMNKEDDDVERYEKRGKRKKNIKKIVRSFLTMVNYSLKCKTSKKLNLCTTVLIPHVIIKDYAFKNMIYNYR